MQKHRDIEIKVQTDYAEQQSNPEQDHYVFTYTVTIYNHGSMAAQLINRHWVITDAEGKVQEVRGEGVVGEQPYLRPGDSFEYTSAAIITTPVGSMHGSYGMRDEEGTEFDAEIPAFSLARPHSLH